MKEKLLIGFVIAVTAPLNVTAQDASSVTDASTKAMGAAMLQSIRYTGTGTNNSVGQAFTSGGPWPRYKVMKYAALVNYSVPAMRQEIIRIDNESVRFRATSSKTKIQMGVQRLELSTFG